MEEKKIREIIKEQLEMGTGSVEFDTDHIVEELMPYLQQELDRAREEVQFNKEELECIERWYEACSLEWNSFTLDSTVTDWSSEEITDRTIDKLSKLTTK